MCQITRCTSQSLSNLFETPINVVTSLYTEIAERIEKLAELLFGRLKNGTPTRHLPSRNATAKINRAAPLPPSAPAPHTVELLQYYEMTKRLPHEQKAKLEISFAHFETDIASITATFKAFEEANFDVFANKTSDEFDTLATQALFALKKGIITKETFSTFLNFRVAKTHYSGFKAIPLFIGDQKNPEAVACIKRMLYYYKSPVTEGTLDLSRPLLNDEEFEEFFQKLQKMPASANVFYRVDDDYKQDEPRTISKEIQNSTGINIFNRDGASRIIPSFEMMQTFVQVLYKEQAVTLNPVLGLSTMGHIIDNNLFDTRDIMLAFPGIPSPDEADNFPATGFDFTFHDFYHAILASGLKSNHRQAYALFAQILQYCHKGQNRVVANTLTAIYDRILDMELSHSKPHATPLKLYDQNKVFWFELVNMLDLAVQRATKVDAKLDQEKRVDPDLHAVRDYLEHSKVPVTNLVADVLFTTLQQLERAGVDWEREFGISLRSTRFLPYMLRNIMLADYRTFHKNETGQDVPLLKRMKERFTGEFGQESRWHLFARSARRFERRAK